MTGTLKDQGNDLFRQGDYLKAAATYTKAIKEGPTAVLYSNRSAALLKLNKVAKALADAEECIKLDPAWDKGYMRMAVALETQDRLEEAMACYQKALHAAEGNAEYTAKVRTLSKAINRRSQVAAKVAKFKKSPAEEAALAFADAKLSYAAELIKDKGSNFAPELFFLQGRSSSAGGSNSSIETDESAVRAEQAFAAPEVLAQFVQQMRAKVEELGAKAVLVIAPKQAIAFPQTWRKPEWPFGEHNGVFVQLQALLRQAADSSSSSNGSTDQQAQASSNGSSSDRIMRKVWFIRLRENKPPLEAQEVSLEFEILPLLLK